MDESVSALRVRIDRALSEFVSSARLEVAAADPAALPAIDEIARILASGGKRLRPAFCYWGHRAAGGSGGMEIVRAAASLELLHTFAIVHDDVMDASPMRRGAPATHLAFGGGRFGESAAILVGDLAFTLADRMLLESGFAPDRIVEALRWYGKMRLEVVAGQFVDVSSSGRTPADEPAARRIAALKSGGYTVEKPLAIGAALAGGSPEVLAALSAFGSPLGVAFQLRDDVLGAFGEPSVTGKDAHGDLREGKRTVLVAKARALATPEDRAFLDARLGSPDLSSRDADRLREVLRSSGALSDTLELIEELGARATAALDGAGFSSEVAAALGELATLAAARDA